MALPYTVSQSVWVAKDASETKELASELSKCATTVIEVITTGFTGTLDIKGKDSEGAAYDNVRYVPLNAAIYFPSVAQISYGAPDTARYRYCVAEYWYRLQLVMARTAGSITVNVVGIDVPSILPLGTVDAYGHQYMDLGKWAGTALTGRDITLDLKALTDDSIKGLLKSIGDIGAGSNLVSLITTIDTVLDNIKAKTDNLNVALSTIASQATLVKLIPIGKAAVFNTALPAAEVGWLATAITPTNSPSYLRIYACVSVSGILRVARTVGGVTITEDLNSGAALAADAAYMFSVPWRTGDSINIRYSVTSGTINRLLIDEIGGAE